MKQIVIVAVMTIFISCQADQELSKNSDFSDKETDLELNAIDESNNELKSKITSYVNEDFYLFEFIQHLGKRHHKKKQEGVSVVHYNANGEQITVSKENKKDVAKVVTTFSNVEVGGVKKHKLNGTLTVNIMGDEANRTKTIVFNELTVDGHQLEGTKTTVSQKSDSEIIKTTNLESASVIKSDGTKYTWTSTKTKTIKNPKTESASQTVSFETSFVAANSTIVYSKKTEEDIIKDRRCESQNKKGHHKKRKSHHKSRLKPSSGKVKITNNNHTILIDMTTTDCTSKPEITVDGTQI